MQLGAIVLSTGEGACVSSALGTLGFREGNHVADRFGTGHQRYQAVQAEGQATVRRRAVLQVIEQEAEFGMLVFRADFQRGKHLGLHVGAVDTRRSRRPVPSR